MLKNDVFFVRRVFTRNHLKREVVVASQEWVCGFRKFRAGDSEILAT
jgi:hypothetical protein